MATTIRINEDVKEQLKLKSVQTGVSQIDLANKYIIEGIKNDTTPNKPIKNIKEIEKILKHDNNNKKVKKIDFNYVVPDNLKLKHDDEANTPVTNINDIKKLLVHDKVGESDVLEQLNGSVHSDKITDAVKLKKEAYKRK